MSRPVPLLPGPPRPPEGQAGPVVTQTGIVLRKRKQPMTIACDECRKRKSKCNDVHSMLREKPEEVALAIFRRIRTGADPEAILDSMEGGGLLMPLHLAPSSEFQFTFPYRSALPGIFAKTNSAYMESLAFEAPSLGQAHPHVFDPQAISDSDAPRYMPYHSAKLVESMLDYAKISGWTAVCADESLLHSLMEAYFQHIYSAFPFFHKDYFLRDLGSGSRRFCSSLLVNAVLAHACHATPTVAYRNEHWNPHNIGYFFLAEARRLSDLEFGRSKITTIQAMLVMNATMNDHGIDGISYQYLTKAVALANLVGLFNPPGECMNQDMEQDTKIVREVTAWALFAWQGIMSSMFHEPPLVKEPPQTPYPDPAEFPFWYGDLWVRYPSSQEPTSTKYHQTFKAYLDFWTIFNEIGLVLFRPVQVRSLYLGQAVEFYARLRSWFDGLPDDLHPRNIVLPFQLKLHIQYWALLMDLFRPFAGWDDLTKALDKTPSEIYRDARMNQERVLWIYYLRHGTETHDCWLTMFLHKLGFLALQEVASSSDHATALSTLILALTSLDNQGKCCFRAEFTLRTICAQMTSRDLEVFKQFATFEDLDVPQAIASRIIHIKSDWPVNLDYTRQERKSIRDVAAEVIGMNLAVDE
ncbi:hypothetical protein FGADI_6611 [Fusarium gaditjirri]|uniref:Xylanolytic transcriptional activator regulatory domain-containing protein n=1 Tax=Fusarium gaditjirri TaxID=282569 RepID=A0A8H4T742_9HYPO|nr:hypothetical protein FGADI_6611 [Fusarium gaditjirri]